MLRRSGAPSPPAQVDEPLHSGGRPGGPPTGVRVIIASDGKRGHENQSRVLARMLGDTAPLLMHLRNPEGGLAERLLRARFALMGPKSLSQQEAAALVRTHLKPESPEEFRDFAAEVGKHRAEYRVFTISTGTPPATMNLLLARLLGAEPLCVMTPSLLPRKLFRLQIIPPHDLNGTPTDNVIVHPLALSFHDVQGAQLQASQLQREFELSPETHYWTLAIGGPTGTTAKWNLTQLKEDAVIFLASISYLVDRAEELGVRLLVTTSRRTPPALGNAVRELTARSTACFIDSKQDARNPLPAFYELSKGVSVTADSYSMLCEAIQAGHKPHYLMPILPQRNIRAVWKRLKGIRSDVLGGDEESAEIYEYPRAEPNLFYNQLRAEVRSRLQLD